MALGLLLLMVPMAMASTPPTFLRQHASGPIVMPLGRRLAHVGETGATTLKSFYTGTVQVGKAPDGPQELLVFFDTGSGQVVLDSTRCSVPSCLAHRRYNADGSGAVSVDSTGRYVPKGAANDVVTISLDTNDVEPGKVTGNFVQDRICLGMERSRGSRAEACAAMTLVAATNMTDEPFLKAPFDGIVGLGLEGLSVSSAHNFFGNLVASTKLQPQFAIFVPPGVEDGHAEITFGGHNAARLASPLTWVPVVQPEQGFWQVAIESISVGARDLGLCGGGSCRGIVDSSSSMIATPSELLPELEAALAAEGDDCSQGEDLHMVLQGGHILTLRAKEHSQRQGDKCKVQLHPLTDVEREKAGRRVIDHKEVKSGGLQQHTFVLGEPVLRRYYTVYDWDAKRIGFGTSSSAESKSSSDARPATEEFILMQCKAELKRPLRP